MPPYWASPLRSCLRTGLRSCHLFPLLGYVGAVSLYMMVHLTTCHLGGNGKNKNRSSLTGTPSARGARANKKSLNSGRGPPAPRAGELGEPMHAFQSCQKGEPVKDRGRVRKRQVVNEREQVRARSVRSDELALSGTAQHRGRPASEGDLRQREICA